MPIFVIRNGILNKTKYETGIEIDKLAPIVTESAFPYVDPIPQALILTAIVIGFGVTVYLVVLLYRIFLNSDSTDQKDVYNL